ncbi:hypothetical protein Tco_1022731 [Tanacetum coccineum]
MHSYDNISRRLKSASMKFAPDVNHLRSLSEQSLSELPSSVQPKSTRKTQPFSEQSVAMSSAEAKYVATARCCANIVWMKSQLSDYDINYKMVPIFCDNTSAIAISNNSILHSRTKHIDIRYHFIRDHILKGDIELHFILIKYQLPDIFTKPLDEPTFTRLKAELGMLNID